MRYQQKQLERTKIVVPEPYTHQERTPGYHRQLKRHNRAGLRAGGGDYHHRPHGPHLGKAEL